MPSNPTLLVAVDPVGGADAVVAQGTSLARGLGASVVVLHVMEPLPGVHVDSPRADAREVARNLVAEVERDLAPILTRFLDAGVPVRTEIREGDAAATILQAADDVGATMIVVGTAGREGLARLVVGSVAEGVIRRSHLPVVTVREG